MNAVSLNPSQQYILRLFAANSRPTVEQELEDVLTSYFFDKVESMGSQIWQDMHLTQEQLQKLASIHDRVAY